MKRRPLLRVGVATLAAAGGVGASNVLGPPTDGVSPNGGDRRSESTTNRDGSLSVERVRTFDRAVRLNDLGADPNGTITAFSDLSARERRVVSAAIDGAYRTRDPDGWLARFVGRTPFVDRAGRCYRLEHTLPTTRVTAEPVAASDVEGAIASPAEYRDAVTHDERARTGLLRAARHGGIELTAVRPALGAFLRDHEAVRYRGGVHSLSVEVRDPGAPYRITATPVAVAAAVGGSVWNASGASRPTRELLRAAGRARGAYGFDRAPDGVLDRLAAHEFVSLHGTFYTATVERREPAPVSVSASVEDGEIRIALGNEADRDLRLSTGPPRPFGVLNASPIGDGGERHLLWTDAYAASDRVRTAGRAVVSVDTVGLASRLGPGDAVSETYDLAGEDFRPGEYAVEGSVSVSTGDEGPGRPVEYRVLISVE